MRRIGFVVNPLAGLGGNVGLKGSDGITEEALRRGAVPHAMDRAREMLKQIHASDIHLFTCSGLMGEAVLSDIAKISWTVIYHPADITTAKDTKEACRRFLEEHVDLILFCGGDGTARDVFDIVGTRVPVLGIPAGVKMFSGVFALAPAAAAEVLNSPKPLEIREAEILDVDEEMYRLGSLSTHLYGIARVPVLEARVQLPKHVIEEQDEERAKVAIARFISEVMLPNTLYIIGAGTTTQSIVSNLGLQKTLLGVDVIRDGNLIAADANERLLLALLDGNPPVRIIVSPIGAQGFIFGRGTQQISGEVIRKVGIPNIIIVATPAKCRETPVLHVDTGDPSLDAQFPDSIQVITGYRIAERKAIGR